MKYSYVALALVAAVQAQIPACAVPCLDKAIESETTCDVKDYPCVCKNFSKVRGIATTCVIEECGAEVAVNEVLPATEELCKNPKDESGSSSDKETTVSAPAATVTAGTTTVAEETSTVAETTTVAVDTTTVSSPVSSPVGVSTTVVVLPPVTPNATMATPTAGAPSESTSAAVIDNGAAALTGLGGVAMLALAALAL